VDNSASATHLSLPATPEELLEVVYDELRKLAAARIGREAPGQTLQATALVHEAWLRLGADHQPAWENQAQFFSAAAEAMRRILIDRARRRKALRRGGDLERIELDALEIPVHVEDEQLLALHEALEHLAEHDATKAELVKMKFFVGMTLEEAADVLGLSFPTAKRHWAYARAWLFREMSLTGEKQKLGN
jgi:RNA polymerase sigma factor (TIGR02999 family)